MKTVYFIFVSAFLFQTFPAKADGLKINLGNDKYTSSTELLFTATSTAGFEKGLDREYRKPPGNHLNYIYSIAEAKHKLYVNYLQKPSGYIAIDLQVMVREAGAFSFYVEERTNNSSTGFDYSLTDSETGNTMSITPDNMTELIFTASDVHRKKNFILHIFPSLTISSSQVSCKESKDGKITVEFNPGGEWEARLKTTLETILKTEKTEAGKINFENLPAGVYFAEVWKNNIKISEEYIAVSKPSGLQSKFTLSNDTILPGQRFSTNNLSSGGNSWYWEFGDGKSSNAYDVAHAFTNPGNYTVTLTTANTTGCISKMSKTIIVKPFGEKIIATKISSTF